MGVSKAICDMDMHHAKDIADRYNAKLYPSVEEIMYNERSLDACLVCTPTKTHFAIAKKMMEKGVNVFVEKPLSFSSKECEEITRDS